jgi:hypothetical protein
VLVERAECLWLAGNTRGAQLAKSRRRAIFRTSRVPPFGQSGRSSDSERAVWSVAKLKARSWCPAPVTSPD